MKLIALVVVVSFVLLSGCVTPINGYEGPTLARENTALVRVIAVGKTPMGVDLINPLTNDPIPKPKFVVDRYGRTPWLNVPQAKHCLVARSFPLRCPSIFEVFDPSNNGCRPAGLAKEQEICFEARGGKSYEIRITTQCGSRCCAEEVLYTLVDLATDNTIGEYPTAVDCRASNDA